MKIGIAGAGLLGRITAIELLDRGHEIELFDKGESDGATSCGYAGAGMLAPYAELGVAEPIIHMLGMDAIPLWKKLTEQLDLHIYFQSEGSLIVAHHQDRHELDDLHRKIMRRLPSPIGVEWLDDQGVRQLEPELHKFARALYLPFEAQVSPRDFYTASTAWLQTRTTWHVSTHIEDVGGRTITTKNKAHTFDLVVDCRGIGGKQHHPSLRGVRGELIHLHAPDVQIQRPVRLMHPRYPLYIVPRPNHNYLVGATSIESNDMSPISVQSALELLSAAFSLHAGFAEARITELVTHCRPGLEDNLPKVVIQPGLMAVNGLFRHGYLVAPALAKLVADRIDGKDGSRYQNLICETKS